MSKSLIKPTENEASQKSKTRCENPYKPVEKEEFWPGNAKKLPKWSKSITLIDTTHKAFRYVKKPYKPNKKQGFSKAKNALRKPLLNQRQIDDFRVENAKNASKMIKKAIRL